MIGLYTFVSPSFSILLHQGYTYANPLDSMMFIDSLLSHATDTYWAEFTLAIERLKVPKPAVRLTSSYIIEDLTPSILDFQANVVRVMYRLKMTAVDPEEPEVQEVLNTVWRVQSGRDPQGVRQSQARSAHSPAAEWRPEVGLGGGGTVARPWE